MGTKKKIILYNGKIMNEVFLQHQNSNIYNTTNQDNLLNTLNDKVIEFERKILFGLSGEQKK